jgi:hypothetical protein
MKVSELEGESLNYWVAKANGWIGPVKFRETQSTLVWKQEGKSLTQFFRNVKKYRPSEDWWEAGPIIEREKIMLTMDLPEGTPWHARIHPHGWQFGHTPLVAAMRAFVASKFGKEVPDDAAAVASFVEPDDCQQFLRASGKPYPRTCAACGLGPCKRR